MDFMGNYKGYLKIVNEIAESKADKVRNHLNSDEEIRLFEAVLGNVLDCNNKLRLNNFAYAAREFVRIYLDNRAKDEQIKKCVWFDENNNGGKITRKDKIRYVIHKSLPVEYVKDILSVDCESDIKDMLNSIDKLSKYTHISGTFEIDNDDSEIAKQVLNAFWGILDKIDETEAKIIDELSGFISEIITEDYIFNYVDGISTHSCVSGVEHFIDEIDFFDDFIFLSISGSIDEQHQWGSNSDVRHGDGITADSSRNFTMHVKVFFDYDDPHSPLGEIEVDDDSFWVEEVERFTNIKE